MTFKQILDDAAERLGNQQPEARVRFRRYLNEWYHRILTEVGLARGGSASLAVVAATPEVTLPVTSARVKQIFDSTNALILRERPLGWIRDQDPQSSSSGTPVFYAYVSNRTIRLFPIPSANNTLTVDHDAVVSELDEDADVPVIDEDFHYLLSLGIRLNEYDKRDDPSRYKRATDEMGMGIARYRYWLASRSSHIGQPAIYGDGQSQPSRLGSWYPRGR